MYFQKLKELFFANILMYKNLSHFSNIYYGLGYTKEALQTYFPKFSYLAILLQNILWPIRDESCEIGGGLCS